MDRGYSACPYKEERYTGFYDVTVIGWLKIWNFK